MLKLQKMGLPNAFRFLTGRDSPDNNSGGDKRDKHLTEATKSPEVQPKPPPLDLNYEVNRLKTFENWQVTYIDKHLLALLGFYYYGPSDMVKCYFCGVEIGMWEEGDDVLADHMRWSPSCNLMRRNETSNIPISEAILNSTLPARPDPQELYFEQLHTVSEGAIDTIGEDDVNMYERQMYAGRSLADESEPASEDDVHMYQHEVYGRGGLEAVLRGPLQFTPIRQPGFVRPEHSDYALETRRLESYEDWPKTMRQKPQQLSDAGFFYTGKGDRVCCFSCGGGLKDWEENDDPWEQHAMWYGKCEYLKLMKGNEFIENMVKQRDEICKRSSEGREASSSSQSSQESLKNSLPSTSTSSENKEQENSDKSDEEEEKKDSKLCKICYNNEYNTIFLPCGHVIACAKCASSVTKCPACRQPFENVMRVYFS